MAVVSVGGRAFRIRAIQRDGRWIAYAIHVDGGDRFGPDVEGASEADVVGRLTRWLEWQHEHAAALADLQRAEREYHRSVAGHAFAAAGDRSPALEARRRALEQMEAARARLDDVRLRHASDAE